MEQEQSGDCANQVRTDAGSAARPNETISSAKRFWPGFAWGLAAGCLGLVGMLVAGGVALAAIQMSQFTTESPSPLADVVISPVKAGADWFSVDANGRGTLKGWTDGASGQGSDFGAADTVGYIEVGTIGAVGGVKLKHSVSVFLTNDTKIFKGDTAYTKGTFKSAAAAVMRDGGEFGNDVISDRELTVEFHRTGQNLVADTIHVSDVSSENPLY